jgi:hypothetical protein
MEDARSSHESAEMKAADGDPGLDVVAGAVAPPGSGLPAGAKPCPPPARQRQDVQTLMDEHRAALQERGGAVVYLVEAAWWRRWQAPSGASSEPLPPIDNRPLLAADALKTLEGGGKEEDLWLPLREGLAADTTSGDGDVVAVPPPAWDALRSWHGGGPPLPRLQLRSAPDADLYPTAPVTPGNAEKLLLDALADEDDDDEGAPPPLALTRVVSAESIARFKSLSLAEVSAGAADCGNNVSMVPDPADPTKLLRQEVRKICFVCKVRKQTVEALTSTFVLHAPLTVFPFVTHPGPVDDALLAVQGRVLLQPGVPSQPLEKRA